MQTPTLKLMSCYYRCKSHCTLRCDAKLQMREKHDKPGVDECLVSADHSDLCKQKNGIKPKKFSTRTDTTEAKIRDVSEEFKNRLVELAITRSGWLQ